MRHNLLDCCMQLLLWPIIWVALHWLIYVTGCTRGAGQTLEKLKNRHIDDVFVGYLIKAQLSKRECLSSNPDISYLFVRTVFTRHNGVRKNSWSNVSTFEGIRVQSEKSRCKPSCKHTSSTWSSTILTLDQLNIILFVSAYRS